GVVICEWELDADRTLLDDRPPSYLTGVFYQRRSAHEGSGGSAVERLFFASMASSSVSELSLDGLPLFVEDSSRAMRRNLNGFRRRLRQLDSEHPDLQVFVSDTQNKFEEELSSRGIDPVVFHYQILMNEREGGVAERFSFPQDEDFLDFLIEMAFDQNRAREVREQLTTFRHELVERNEQLKPELEYCRGMIVRLQKMVGVERDRSLIYSEIEVARRRVIAMSECVTATLATLNSEQQQLQSTIRASKDAADTARKDADRSNRIAAVHRRHIAQLRFDTIQNEYVAAEQA